MSNIYLYFHGGSENHGCEAIVRSTVKILGDNLTLASSNRKTDEKYDVNDIINIIDDVDASLSKMQSIISGVYFKLFKSDYMFTYYRHKALFDRVKKGDICISIGGDNYCYKGQDILGHYNSIFHKKGAKTVLWGCSVEPDVISGDVAKDLGNYDLIVTREPISYSALRAVNKNTVLLPDPAFQLDVEAVELPRLFDNKNIVGINLSPLVSSYANGELIYNNYIKMIEHILNNTDMDIALIPHVVQEGNDDREILKTIFDKYKDTNRVCMLDDQNCTQIKYCISNCRFFIGARTHATIAAYSTCVPTLVAGYSVKAIGIAQELFGTDENYVVPVQKFQTENDLTNAFKWLFDNEQLIKNHLSDFIPSYKLKILSAKELVETL